MAMKPVYWYHEQPKAAGAVVVSCGCPKCESLKAEARRADAQK